MHKRLIALAVGSLLCGAVTAQSNVALYGIVDAGYAYSSGSAGSGMGTNTFSGITSGIANGPRLGLKGEEALGNGLKAVFTLEYALNIDDNSGIGNTGGLNARQQFVGLASDKLGKVALGRQYSPGYLAAYNNDALESTDMSIQSSLSALSGSTITPNSPARFNNAVTYTSVNYSGFTASAIYGFGETTGAAASTADNGQFGLGGNYVNGPLNVDLVYQSRQNVQAANPYGITGNGKDVNEWFLGGAYDFKVVKAFASYQALNNKNAITTGAIADTRLWTLGVNAPVGRGTFALSYGKLSLDKKSAADGDSWGAGTMYTYPLSKRTAVYAAYSYFNNDSNSIAAQAIVIPATIGAAGESNYTVGAGMYHTF